MLTGAALLDLLDNEIIPSWQSIAIKVLEFHNTQPEDARSIRQTAELIGRSKGWTCESIYLALGLRSFPKLDTIKTRDEALIFLRRKHAQSRRVV